MQEVIDIGRLIRERNTLPIKYPLSELVVVHEDSQYLDDVKSLEKYIVEELNIKTLTVTKEKQNYGVVLRAEPDVKEIGKKFRSESKKISQAVKELSGQDLHHFVTEGQIVVCGQTLGQSDIRLMHSFSGEKANELSQKYQVHSAGEVLVLLDVTRNQEMMDEGTAREVINRIQKLRKKAHLVPSDPITVYVGVKPPSHNLSNVVTNFGEFISNTLKVPLQLLPSQTPPGVIIEETSQIKDAALEIVICTPNGITPSNQQKEPESDKRKKLKIHHENNIENGEPVCKFVNIELCDVGTCSVLLENPKGKYILSGDALIRQVQVVFGIHGKRPELYLSSDKTKPLNNLSEKEVLNLHKRTLYAYLS
ncbi:isoleucine--tRNA ligase, cytoplasmic [Caerostris extrusa]|uniref:Isoleucine--tRNA ligase, cytoplasmic n=1 Tax=Caerostris extrusa TaxID=172846 RepID=A0AAV4PGE5_CAEEX|nr:isoleucine--tRNA ligase, cytoplasmic [Caerostris extrusa]